MCSARSPGRRGLSALEPTLRDLTLRTSRRAPGPPWRARGGSRHPLLRPRIVAPARMGVVPKRGMGIRREPLWGYIAVRAEQKSGGGPPAGSRTYTGTETGEPPVAFRNRAAEAQMLAPPANRVGEPFGAAPHERWLKACDPAVPARAKASRKLADHARSALGASFSARSAARRAAARESRLAPPEPLPKRRARGGLRQRTPGSRRPTVRVDLKIGRVPRSCSRPICKLLQMFHGCFTGVSRPFHGPGPPPTLPCGGGCSA